MSTESNMEQMIDLIQAYVDTNKELEKAELAYIEAFHQNKRNMARWEREVYTKRIESSNLGEFERNKAVIDSLKELGEQFDKFAYEMDLLRANRDKLGFKADELHMRIAVAQNAYIALERVMTVK